MRDISALNEKNCERLSDINSENHLSKKFSNEILLRIYLGLAKTDKKLALKEFTDFLNTLLEKLNLAPNEI